MVWTAILRSRPVRWLGLALAALLAGLGIHAAGRRAGRKDASEKAHKDTINRVEKGRAQVDRHRDDDPADRLRRNDGQW